LWQLVSDAVEGYHADLPHLPVAPRCGVTEVRARLAGLDLGQPMSSDTAIQFVVEGLRSDQLHTAHPGYFGLFVPAPSAIGVAADALASGFNPQLASWGHSPFAVEAEQWVVRALATRLGYPGESVEGIITSGGSEANLTGLLVALYHAWPSALGHGVRGVPGTPCLYLSDQAHESWRKAVRMSGLGEHSLRVVPCDPHRIDVAALARLIAADRRDGLLPFLIVGTVGATASGGVDSMLALSALARREGLWLHADAAWGGAAALSARHADTVAGLHAADSMTLDPHKWLSVPMGAGVYLSRRPGGLCRVFRTTPRYLPASSAEDQVNEPYQESPQWSRRFSGLKILLTLLTAGWEGVDRAIAQSFDLAAALRAALPARRWSVCNHTPLPVICFQDAGRRGDLTHHERLVAGVNQRGRSWVSLARVGGGQPSIRVCMTNYRTTSHHIGVLLDDLESARSAGGEAPPA
jgi:glutamate/tyrosine decarboxylase-like PLP-dependent enzyme